MFGSIHLGINHQQRLQQLLKNGWVRTDIQRSCKQILLSLDVSIEYIN